VRGSTLLQESVKAMVLANSQNPHVRGSLPLNASVRVNFSRSHDGSSAWIGERLIPANQRATIFPVEFLGSDRLIRADSPLPPV
jgi:hypothetical protein